MTLADNRKIGGISPDMEIDKKWLNKDREAETA